ALPRPERAGEPRHHRGRAGGGGGAGVRRRLRRGRVRAPRRQRRRPRAQADARAGRGAGRLDEDRGRAPARDPAVRGRPRVTGTAAPTLLARCGAPGAPGSLLGLTAVAVAEALLELLDAALRVDEALLARVERVVAGPHVDVQLGLRAVGLHDDLAVADDLGGDHLGVDALLHVAAPSRAPAAARGAWLGDVGGPAARASRAAPSSGPRDV